MQHLQCCGIFLMFTQPRSHLPNSRGGVGRVNKARNKVKLSENRWGTAGPKSRLENCARRCGKGDFARSTRSANTDCSQRDCRRPPPQGFSGKRPPGFVASQSKIHQGLLPEGHHPSSRLACSPNLWPRHPRLFGRGLQDCVAGEMYGTEWNPSLPVQGLIACDCGMN
jgi:hypothetical protein